METGWLGRLRFKLQDPVESLVTASVWGILETNPCLHMYILCLLWNQQTTCCRRRGEWKEGRQSRGSDEGRRRNEGRGERAAKASTLEALQKKKQKSNMSKTPFQMSNSRRRGARRETEGASRLLCILLNDWCVKTFKCVRSSYLLHTAFPLRRQYLHLYMF